MIVQRLDLKKFPALFRQFRDLFCQFHGNFAESSQNLRAQVATAKNLKNAKLANLRAVERNCSFPTSPGGHIRVNIEVEPGLFDHRDFFKRGWSLLSACLSESLNSDWLTQNTDIATNRGRKRAVLQIHRKSRSKKRFRHQNLQLGYAEPDSTIVY